jgi:L-alanine-DL-glutamate epimerase-like enolase superfamily enzyme
LTNKHPFAIHYLPKKQVLIFSISYLLSFFRAGAIMGALSAIDIALLDITGKYLEVPVYQLLGGKLRDNVRICDTFFTPHNEIIKETFKFEDGHMIVPDTPGIGVELSDDTVLAIYPFKRKEKASYPAKRKDGRHVCG